MTTGLGKVYVGWDCEGYLAILLTQCIYHSVLGRYLIYVILIYLKDSTEKNYMGDQINIC